MMTIEEIRKQSKEALDIRLRELRSALQQNRFSVRQRQLKNVRAIRVTRRTVARILTHLRSLHS